MSSSDRKELTHASSEPGDTRLAENAGSDTPTVSAIQWHAHPAGKVLRMMESSPAGLSQTEADSRLQRYGANVLPAVEGRSALMRFLLQFHNVLIYVLLAAALVTALLGHWIDSGVIVGVVLINAAIGYFQEGKAEKALEAIRNLLSLSAQALRDGSKITVPAEALVPGDIVFIASGDKVPADLRMLEIRSLKIEEAILTGESMAVEKQTEPVASQADLGDRFCMAYSGTIVNYGQGRGVVVATGASTEIGRISTSLGQTQTLVTPLLRKLSGFGRTLTVAILVTSVLLFAYGTLIHSYAADEMFLAAVGLAVAAIPEGLPAIITITLALGVQRMARRRAIIRRLPAVEALGSVTVICTDKTGTLTRNEMTVQQVITAENTYAVTGAGYAPEGDFTLDAEAIDLEDFPLLSDIARTALLCNDASLCQEKENWRVTGDPTEGALLTLAKKAKLTEAAERQALVRIDVIPFESEHRFMATLHRDVNGNRVVFLKGAPEKVMALCHYQRTSQGDMPLEMAVWVEKMETAAKSGMRLLALALRDAKPDAEKLSFADIEEGCLTLLAVVGITDPPRDEARAAVAACRSAGVRVKMITGDHAATAAAIGENLALSDRIQTLTGSHLDALDDLQLLEAVAETDVFARASPEHKLRLVKALQARGEIVAMTGDGVNDAPALKRADVGVAMGCKGTEAAKETAEIVLTDDNFASIVAATEEGRAAYDNIRKAILFVLPTNGGQAGIILVAVIMGMNLPITPVQILWVNMVIAVTLSLSIAFEKAEVGVMQRPPRAPEEALIHGRLAWRILFVAGLLVIGGMILFNWELQQGATLETARTVAINALVMGQVAYLFNCRSMTEPVLNWQGVFGNRYVWWAIGILLALQLLLTYWPPMQGLFQTTSIDVEAWARIFLFSLALLMMVELEKAMVRRMRMH